MQIRLPKPAPCIDCGSDPVFHHRDYVVLFIDLYMVPLFSVFEALAKFVFKPFQDPTLFPDVYDMLARLGMGTFLDAYDEKTLLLDQVLWDEARARGITMREFRFLGIPGCIFVATFPDGRRISFDSFPAPRGASAGVWWIDTKSVMKKKFQKLGIPTPPGGAAYTRYGARKLFASLKAPVIVKPYQGSGSRHTSIHITTQGELDHAFAVSQKITTASIVEEELVGAVYRPTLVGGKLIATIKRDQPEVEGDGVHTIEWLVQEANKHPKRQGPYYGHIGIEEEANLKELSRQHMTPKSVPAKGAVVTLHPKINWSVGGTTTDVTDIVHPDNKELFERVAAILGAPVIGIDFIIGDISRSWKEQERCGVIECNSRPFFDNHHLPFNGEPRNVAGAIWDRVM